MTSRLALALLCASALLVAQTPSSRPITESRKTVNLPSSKRLVTPALGAPQRITSFPATIAISPDKHYAAILNQGWGLPEFDYDQSIAIVDVQSGKLTEFPDARLTHKSKMTYFFGLAWSADGTHLYASIASLTNPEGLQPPPKEPGKTAPNWMAEGDLGNGIASYLFTASPTPSIAAERFIPIPPQPLDDGTKRAADFKHAPAGTAPPFPAQLVVIGNGDSERLLVADNLSDDVLVINPRDGSVLQRYDLSAHNFVPSEYPLAVTASRDGKRAWITLYNASSIAELDFAAFKIARVIRVMPPQSAIDPSSRPIALQLSKDEHYLMVALANRDSIAVIDTKTGRLRFTMPTRLQENVASRIEQSKQSLNFSSGTYPIALAQSEDGDTLYVADAALNAVATFDLRKALAPSTKCCPQPEGFIPTEWYPTSLAVVNGELLVGTAKGQGSGPNNMHWQPGEGTINKKRSDKPYILALTAGSLARVNLAEAHANLAELTKQVVAANRMNEPVTQMPFAGGKSPIHHVIYFIKENRSYDQVFGDIKGANGDPSLVMYGEDITPNQHKLAREFGVLDNFYVSGEVSGEGHVWSNAAISSEYTEIAVPLNYRNGERGYDFEGTNLGEIPSEHDISDINEPGTNYLWTNAARHNVSYRTYGEYVVGLWCSDRPEGVPAEGFEAPPEKCSGPKVIEKGDPLPGDLGSPNGSASPYPWKIRVLAGVRPTKKELREHAAERYAPWNLDWPDQLRADAFLNEFAAYVRAREDKRTADELPGLLVVRLGNNHTSGTTAGRPKPEAQVADNDLALGRIVDAVMHSIYWDDTAIFVLEDDAQNGPDHVEAHRSPALIISKYSHAPEPDRPYVDSHFYTTVNLIHTMESLLGLPPMNQNDAHAVPMWTMFTAAPRTVPPFRADTRNLDNGLIYQVNPKTAPGAVESSKMDFSHPDAVDADVLNAILWHAAKGDQPMPKTPKNPMFNPAGRRDDDDRDDRKH